jgi:hypothetical protein
VREAPLIATPSFMINLLEELQQFATLSIEHFLELGELQRMKDNCAFFISAFQKSLYNIL